MKTVTAYLVVDLDTLRTLATTTNAPLAYRAAWRARHSGTRAYVRTRAVPLDQRRTPLRSDPMQQELFNSSPAESG